MGQTMKTLSAFDIIGPRMMGPSSSHTAGAARLAKMAGRIGGPEIIKVCFTLYGSFAKTYKGHGTDKALVAGILGMRPRGRAAAGFPYPGKGTGAGSNLADFRGNKAASQYRFD